MNLRLVSFIIGAALLILSLGCEKEIAESDTLIYGHAGTTIYPERWVYPANTLESIAYAMDVLDADGVEVDVQISKDGIPFLYHDPYLVDHTDLTGCVPGQLAADLKTCRVYHSSCRMAELETAISLVLDRKKKLFLDLKPYHYCEGKNLNDSLFNASLNSVLEKWPDNQLQNIVLNTRNAELLEALSNDHCVKSLETDDPALALHLFEMEQIDEVCFKANLMTTSIAAQFESAGLPFSLFGVKTTKEIERAMTFKPRRIITDNIAYTRKLIKS